MTRMALKWVLKTTTAEAVWRLDDAGYAQRTEGGEPSHGRDMDGTCGTGVLAECADIGRELGETVHGAH